MTRGTKALPEGLRRGYGRLLARRNLALHHLRWQARVAWRLPGAAGRRLPGFLIIGAQRAGSTALYRQLIAHPEVAPALVKEVHYFSRHHARGPRWYRAHFPRIAGDPDSTARLCCEATPYYLFHPLAAERCAALLPEVKLLAVLRNPIDRAYSHYWHERARGTEPLSFREAIEAEPARLAPAFEALRRDPSADPWALQRYGYLARGRYAEQIARWLQHFDAAQLLVLRSEDLRREPDHELARVHAFLGLNPRPPAPVAQSWNQQKYPKLDPGLRSELAERFREPNAALAAMLGRADMGWNED